MHGPLYYRNLEEDKKLALKLHKGNFDALMGLSLPAKNDLEWWIKNVDDSFNSISHGDPDITITTDASKRGWGAEFENIATGGHWAENESRQHINVLELIAGFIGLKTFAKRKENIHIRLRIDNTTAVSTINHMGTNHSDDCNAIGKQIWEWCIAKKIWLSASYIPGKHNVTADVESRRKQNGSEWMINQKILQQCFESLSFGPDIDHFASRINYQLEKYVSFKPDPGAITIDAFSLDWANLKFYAFPPFSVIPMVLRKIQADKATGICVFPNWPTQAWFPKATAMLLQDPIELKPNKNLLSLPSHPRELHPLHEKLSLIVCLLSGRN